MRSCDAEVFEYFAGKPAGLARSADVLLVLDSGEELPVHSAFLTAHSNLFCDMLSVARKSAEKAKLPVTDCSKDSAVALLNYIYDTGFGDREQVDKAQEIVHLADKLGMPGAIRFYDDFLFAKVESDGRAPVLWPWVRTGHIIACK